MKMLIGKDWRDAGSGEELGKYNPSTGKLMYRFPSATRDDAAEAIESASKAFERWNAMGSKRRAAILGRAAGLILSKRGELEEILIRENGKVKKEAWEEVNGVIDQLAYYVGFERKITGDIVEGADKDRKILQYRVPYGVVVAITPWNFPAAMVTRKLAPALLTGNTVVLKPSSDTPGSAEWIVKMLLAAGLPNGVVNMITGVGCRHLGRTECR